MITRTGFASTRVATEEQRVVHGSQDLGHLPVEIDKTYMHRALQLAKAGLGNVSSNPMVGAVIVSPEGRIIGEGYHRCYGEAHAEVNAVNSVNTRDRHLLKESTIYVTLEPCAHYGKTPPCALLLKECGFKRIVVGARDPFDKVDGRGIDMLRETGMAVVTGVLEDECMSLNAKFFTAHTKHRPFVTLKWAQSSDGYMDVKRWSNEEAFHFSSETGKALVHRLRANHDAIGVGSGTFIADRPKLNVRFWHGTNPRIVIFDRRGRIVKPTSDIADVLSELYADGITSIIIEGGPTLLKSLLDKGLWDIARVEVAPYTLGDDGRAKAPDLPSIPFESEVIEFNHILYYSNNRFVNSYFLQNGF